MLLCFNLQSIADLFRSLIYGQEAVEILKPTLAPFPPHLPRSAVRRVELLIWLMMTIPAACSFLATVGGGKEEAAVAWILPVARKRLKVHLSVFLRIHRGCGGRAWRSGTACGIEVLLIEFLPRGIVRQNHWTQGIKV